MHIEDLEEVISKGIEAVGFPDLYLVEVRAKNNKIEVFLDSDEGVTFLKCQKLSRWLEEILDKDGSFGVAYTLEVSSAGIGSPLRMKRQYRKNIGRFIEIKLIDSDKIRGILAAADEDKVVVTWEEKIKEGKKYVKVTRMVEVTYEQINEAKIKLNL